ncbi:MAG: sulfotransferase [Asgard group archaeon]|nr:sulfotransferase [Asgard group archaeon]
MAHENTKVTEQILSGTGIRNWLRLLWDNRFRISWKYLPRVFFISFISLITAPLAILEKLRYDRKIKHTAITSPPIFIIGHWRSGTTFLHNVLSKDEQFGYVNNITAFLPRVFLTGGRFLRPILQRCIPEKRRMDNMTLGLNEPQEDEYALANLLNYSLYHGMAFPRNIRRYYQYCSFENVPERKVLRWKRTFYRFLQKITFSSKGKQLILKSPSHTYRVKLLLEMFPNAKFIHIYRNPLDVFPSTLNLYQKMFPYFFLQEPFTVEEGKEIIFELYDKMFERYFVDKELIPENNLYELKYEDFVQNPMIFLEDIYAQFSFKDFNAAKINFTSYLKAQKSYQKNKYSLDENFKNEIFKRWHSTFERWGYNRVERLGKRINKSSIRRIKRTQRISKRQLKRFPSTS